MHDNKVQESLNYLNTHICNSQFLSESTTAGNYLIWLADQIREGQNHPLYRDTYRPIIEANKVNKKAIFGSVVVRTQGRRPEALREALLCLYAQSEQDFEVLLIGHKLKPQERETVQLILEELAPEFRKRVRYLPLDTGTRTTPLNYGFAHAHGDYIMVLDDDDLALEHWIANFKKAAAEKPGTLLHSYVYAQKWSVLDAPGGIAALRADDAPDAKYCVDFNLISELKINLCPLIGVAFPAKVFQEWGLTFDETLTTTEDWDYMMRVAFICGVTDVREPGSIYRLWTNAESSATVHNSDEWRKNYDLIQEKMKKTPLIIGRAEAFMDESSAFSSGKKSSLSARSMDDKLYYGHDAQWCDERSMSLDVPRSLGSFKMEYEGLAGKHSYRQLRWDPMSCSYVFIRNLTASVTNKQGDVYSFTAADIHSTGEIYHNGILFMQEKPQLYFDIPEGFEVDRFTVRGESMLQMPIEENSKALKIFIFIKKILQKLHIVK